MSLYLIILILQSSEHDKGVYTVDTMQGSIQTWMTNMETLLRNMSMRQENGERVDALEAALSARLDSMAAVVERMEAHALRPPSTAVASVDTDAIMSHVDVRLARLQGQEDALTELKMLAQTVSHSVAELPTRGEMTALLNTTSDQMMDLKYEVVAVVDKGIHRLDNKMEETHKALITNLEELHKTSSDAVVMAEGFYGDVQKSYEQLLKEVKGLAKVEQVMIQTADNVLDTKRRIEYGVHQILLEIGDLVKLQMKDLNTTVNKRFDNISVTILANQNGGLTNLSSKIEYEISQVWRQIGIMYQQLTASAGALDRLQQQTDAYVNGSLKTMDSMEGKVGQITGRMGEVDDNLNYLLGRLSLVTQEFNQIKSGLGEALDSIKSSFKTVQEQIKDVGPGPNPIHPQEADVDNQV